MTKLHVFFMSSTIIILCIAAFYFTNVYAKYKALVKLDALGVEYVYASQINANGQVMARFKASPSVIRLMHDQVRYINLVNSNVNSETFSLLLYFPSTEMIWLKDEGLDEASVLAITEITELKILHAFRSTFTDKQLKYLQRLKPNLNIVIEDIANH